AYFKSMLVNSYDYKELEIGKSVKKDLSQNLETYYNLNKYIDSKAKVLHLGNDYGQLDVLLTLQEPQRKVFSFINDEEKLAVAKTNYFLKKRKILYSDQIEPAFENQHEILLISDESYAAAFEKIILTTAIILVNCPVLKTKLTAAGFEIMAEENAVTVLKKK
ncbi:MAG: glycerol acyltransferase, partial [Flavobacterium sp.]